MEFDKSKILTVLTADQAKVGQKGWVGNHPTFIESDVRLGQPAVVLSKVDVSSSKPFAREGGYAWALFYPAPEPTYAERQAEWVKENNVKVGTKVRITRSFVNGEDCCFPWVPAMDNTIGKEGTITNICHNRGGFRVSITGSYCGYWYPYVVLEVIKEPTYRPFKNAEEFNPYRDRWVKIKSYNPESERRIVILSDNGIRVVCVGSADYGETRFFSFKEGLKEVEFDDGTPFGIKEEV